MKEGKFALAALIASFGLSACAVTPAYDPYYGNPGPAVVVRTPPPPLPDEYAGPPPVSGFVWVAGYWNWVGARYVWVPGRWEAPRPGYIWIPQRWDHDGDRWRAHGGRWERDSHPRATTPPPSRPPFVDRDRDGRPDRERDDRRRRRDRDDDR